MKDNNDWKVTEMNKHSSTVSGTNQKMSAKLNTDVKLPFVRSVIVKSTTGDRAPASRLLSAVFWLPWLTMLPCCGALTTLKRRMFLGTSRSMACKTDESSCFMSPSRTSSQKDISEHELLSCEQNLMVLFHFGPQWWNWPLRLTVMLRATNSGISSLVGLIIM